MQPTLIGFAVVGLLVATEAFFTTLSAINLRHQERTVAAERDWVIEELGIDDPDEALAYERVSEGVSALRSWTTLALLALFLLSGLFADAISLLATLDDTLVEAAAFFAGLVVAAQLLSVPFDIVETFVVEEVFGFNEQSLGLWLRDTLVGTAVGVVLVVPLGVAVVWFTTSVPLWPVAAWALVVGFLVAFTVIKPRVIDPLFYEFDPLTEGELREAVEEVFETAGYRTDEVYEMNASTRSGHSNAYFVGFGPAKRVVLYDTLIEGMETDAVQSVLAHELAHWREGHIWKFVGLSAVRLAVIFAALGVAVETGVVFGPFGAPQTPYGGLFVGLLVLAPLNRLTSPVENYVSLGYERDADAYAVEVVGGEPMARALASLAADNLSVPFPHPWYETFHYNHPPIPERIRRVRELDPDVTTDAASDPEAAAGD
ncbi:MAG: M48 family metallopeptidase [Halobaculum sp.]